MKKEAGWYEPDWTGDSQWQATRKTSKIRQQVARSSIRYSAIAELSRSVQHESLPGTVHGDFSDGSIPPGMAGFMRYVESQQPYNGAGPGNVFAPTPSTEDCDSDGADIVGGHHDAISRTVIPAHLTRHMCYARPDWFS